MTCVICSFTANCQAGTYSETGVEPCHPCEQGSYQHGIGKVSCIDCPGLTWTYGEGADDLSKCVGKSLLSITKYIIYFFASS